MSVRNSFSLAVLVALLLAACGTEPAGSGLPDSTSTATTPTVASVPATSEPIPVTDTTTPGQEPPERSSPGVRSLPVFATPEGDYWISSTVIQGLEGPPIVCVGGILLSRPPQCGGLVLVGFDWSDVGHEDAGGIRFSGGTYLEGTIDGDTFVVSLARDATESDRQPADPNDFSSPCPEPDGGWTIVDPTLVTDDAFDRAIEYGNTIDDLSAIWVIQPPIEAPDPVDMILNVAVVDNVEEHQEALRARWGGPLCVFLQEGRAADLRAIQHEIAGESFELGVTLVGADEINQTVEVSVIVADSGTLRYFAERFGVATVHVTGHFQPLDSG